MHRIVLSIDLIERGNICICHDRSRDEIGIKVSRGNINPKNSGRDTRDTGLRGERKGWISVGWITRKKESFLLNDLSRKAREGSISKARPFPHVRSSVQTSVFQDEKIFQYFIRENWYSKHEDEDVVKKKKRVFLVSRTKHRLSVLLATRIFHTTISSSSSSFFGFYDHDTCSGNIYYSQTCC